MTTTVPTRSLRERTTGEEESSLPPGVWLEAPPWLLAGVEDEEQIGVEPHIWRGID
jgi:hypothetical protein